MTDELLTALRYKSEGTDIDFKSAQYRFIGGSDEDKAEMLKDILAIANAWRDGPGYILLGFRDQRPHPAAVVGISESIDDAKVQQFVHGKVKPKLTFKYEEHLHEGKTVGVITIPKQKRPFYLAHAYGKLKSNVVYVRRGSSTDEAEPPEIAAMVLADARRGDLRLDLSVLAPNNEELNATFELNYLQFPEELPDYESPRRETGLFGHQIAVPSIWRDNRDFWREYAEYVRVQAALIEMKFILHNRSAVQLSNAKLEVSVEPLDGQDFQMISGADLPDEPESQWSSLRGVHSLPELLDRRNAQLVVDNSGLSPICH
ncbi:helix-turn-helix domain-containing protein, partial [Cupriavidus sp. L7L]|uniref:AlbA family DNA-binding domain-containing protein n=1 Tax=Cupriavidus sp. L7L TaxID=2546443 RepID=UPI001A9EF485